METPGEPHPTDGELIDLLERQVYYMRLAVKSGESTDLHMPDMRPVVLLRIIKLSIIVICAMADKKKLTAQHLKELFAEMRIAERKGRK